MALGVVESDDGLVLLEASFTVRAGLVDGVHVASSAVDDTRLRNAAVVLRVFHVLVDVHDGLDPLLALGVLH